MVAVQSMVTQCWSLRPPETTRAGPCAIQGTRMPPLVHLAADKRPVVGEALATVVAREDDPRVLEPTHVAQCLHVPVALVHVVDHAAVGDRVSLGAELFRRTSNGAWKLVTVGFNVRAVVNVSPNQPCSSQPAAG